MKSRFALFAAVALAASPTFPGLAADTNCDAKCESKFKHFSHQADEAFKHGSYHKAEREWEEALGTVCASKANDDELAWALRRLGETFMKMDRFAEAHACFNNAQQILDNLGHGDNELSSDEQTLTHDYTPIDTGEFGKFEEELMLEAKVEHIGILGAPEGKKIHVKLEHPFFKSVDHPLVRAVSVSRNLHFEVVQKADNSIEIKNIKGLRVKSDHWANLTQITLEAPEANQSKVDITAHALGMERHVSTEVSDKIYTAASKVAAQLKRNVASSRTNSKSLVSPSNEKPAVRKT